MCCVCSRKKRSIHFWRNMVKIFSTKSYKIPRRRNFENVWHCLVPRQAVTMIGWLGRKRPRPIKHRLALLTWNMLEVNLEILDFVFDLCSENMKNIYCICSLLSKIKTNFKIDRIFWNFLSYQASKLMVLI